MAQAILEDRDFGAPDPVSLVEATRAFAGEDGATTPEAQRLVRAAKWTALSRVGFDEAVDSECQAKQLDSQDCHTLRTAFSETVLEALLVEAVSRLLPPEAIAKAIGFYESETGAAIFAYLLDPSVSQPTREQIMRFEEYRAGNPELEGPQGEAIISAVIEEYAGQAGV